MRKIIVGFAVILPIFKSASINGYRREFSPEFWKQKWNLTNEKKLHENANREILLNPRRIWKNCSDAIGFLFSIANIFS